MQLGTHDASKSARIQAMSAIKATSPTLPTPQATHTHTTHTHPHCIAVPCMSEACRTPHAPMPVMAYSASPCWCKWPPRKQVLHATAAPPPPARWVGL